MLNIRRVHAICGIFRGYSHSTIYISISSFACDCLVLSIVPSADSQTQCLNPAMSIHSVKRSQNHLAWDNRFVSPRQHNRSYISQLFLSISPAIRINSGDTVSFDCLDASNGQITASSNTATISTLVFSQLDQVSGPVHIAEAEKGDTLQVEILDIETADWGWTAIIPGFGLLCDEFQDPAIKIWDINKKDKFAWFDETKGIRIPINPFPGEAGVARGIDGAFSTIPPYNTGVSAAPRLNFPVCSISRKGNIDTKHITVGSVLYLPIEVSGALFSIGVRILPLY